jgi:hypothetical protein
MTLHGGSSSAIIRHVFIQRLDTGPRERLWTSFWEWRRPRKLTRNSLSGKRGAPHYQAEYSRNLLFKSGAQMEDLFDRILDRTRSRLDIPVIRTLFGLKTRRTAPARPGRRRRRS